MPPRPSQTVPPKLPVLSETKQLSETDTMQNTQNAVSVANQQITTEMISPVTSPRVFESPLQLLASQPHNTHRIDASMNNSTDRNADDTTAMEMWSWLENLMLELADVEEARGAVCQLAATATNRTALTMPPARNPHTSEPPPLDAVTNLVEQMTKLRVSCYCLRC